MKNQEIPHELTALWGMSRVYDFEHGYPAFAMPVV